MTLTLFPPSFAQSESTWSTHPDLSIISELLGTNLHSKEDNEFTPNEDLIIDSEEEESDNSETDETPETSNKFTALASCIEND